MAGQRIRGDDVAVLVTQDGALVQNITAVRSFEVTLDLEKKKEGYLGERTMRGDDIFNGVDGQMELHVEGQEVLEFIRDVQDRAKRRVPGRVFAIQATMNMPDGTRPIVKFPNVFFGPIPLGFASRADYATVRLDFFSEDWQPITS